MESLNGLLVITQFLRDRNKTHTQIRVFCLLFHLATASLAQELKVPTEHPTSGFCVPWHMAKDVLTSLDIGYTYSYDLLLFPIGHRR